jgi:hypothetical protein
LSEKIISVGYGKVTDPKKKPKANAFGFFWFLLAAE